jgi:lipopolysaccharide transport system permease protein
LTRRELSDLHVGQAAGQIWFIVHPILILVVYAVLFTMVFKVRIGGNGPTDYVVYLLSGLAPWLLTQDSLVRATGSIIASSPIVKKVMFPPEVIVAKTLMSSFVTQGLLFGFAVVFILFAHSGISASWLLLPVLGLVHVVLIWGLALLLSAITPYFRDITEFVRVFVTINIYLMPVTYAPSMVPESLRVLLVANPFSHLIWCYQDVLYFGYVAHPWSWVVLPCLAALGLMIGSSLFSRLRHHFTSVL